VPGLLCFHVYAVSPVTIGIANSISVYHDAHRFAGLPDRFYGKVQVIQAETALVRLQERHNRISSTAATTGHDVPGGQSNIWTGMALILTRQTIWCVWLISGTPCSSPVLSRPSTRVSFPLINLSYLSDFVFCHWEGVPFGQSSEHAWQL
jgi:hypothetical protein